MHRLASFLFARPSFVEGIARIIDFGNTLTEYNVSPTPEEADYYAIRADWCAVGGEIQRASSKFATRIGDKQ